MKISVVIPVFNVSAYIERCLKSVMGQTYSDFECILVDDASPDDSIAKCEQMIAAYEGTIRFRILHHTHNRGLSAARNTGTDAATGEYILFLDSDDAITEDCIEKLGIPIARDSSIDMVMGQVERVYNKNDSSSLSPKNCKDEDISSLEAVRDYFFNGKVQRGYVWNRLVRKDFLCCNNIVFKEGLIWEDQLWIFFVMKHLSHLYVIPDVTYLYYVHHDSITLATNFDVIQHYRGIVFYEISSNFTLGDSNREAKFYLKDFCHHYLGCTDLELYQKTAKLFKKELKFRNDTADLLRLLIVDVLSKTWLGRKTFYSLRKLYRQI